LGWAFHRTKKRKRAWDLPTPGPSCKREGRRSRPSSRALPRDLNVVEGQHPVADDLALFVALAREQDDVVGAGFGNRGGDGFAAAADLGCFRGARHHLAADGGGVFGAGVVVGDDDMIGEAGRDGAHQRPLAAIAVAARAEHDDQATRRVGPQGLDRGLQPIGCMGIIDIDRGPHPADCGAFEAPAHRLNPCQKRENVGHFAARRVHQTRRGERICGLISADQGQFDGVDLALGLDLERLAELGRGAFDQPEGLALLPKRDQAQPALVRDLGDAGRGGIVHPYHGGTVGRDNFAEQAQFGLEIGLHRAVIIEMVAAQIGESARLDRQAFGAELGEAVAGGLERGMGHAFATQASHVGEEGRDVGRGEPGRNAVVGGGDAQRADRGGMMAGHAPELAGQLDGRGLAVGAGDRDHRLRKRREEFGGGLGEGAAGFGVGDMDGALDHRLGTGEDRDRAGSDRVGDIILAIDLGAAEGAEDGAGRNLAAVDRKAGYARIRAALHIPDKLTQPHSWTDLSSQG